MRIFLIAFLLLVVSACTTGTPTSPSWSSGDMVRSSISTEQYSVALQKTIPSPTIGSGTHTMTIYADFQCPACISFSTGLYPLFESYADNGKLIIEFKQFPLTSIHVNAYRDALAGLCSAEQGKYKEAKTALYTLEAKKSGAKVSDSDRIDALVAVGVESEGITQCLSENRYAKQVDDEVVAWSKLWVSGTPTILFDGKKMDLSAIFVDEAKGRSYLDRLLAE